MAATSSDSRALDLAAMDECGMHQRCGVPLSRANGEILLRCVVVPVRKQMLQMNGVNILHSEHTSLRLTWASLGKAHMSGKEPSIHPSTET